MKKKLKDLCSSFPKTARLQSPLDNVATKMFRPDRDEEYIQSSSAPEKRYGIDVDFAALQHHNDYLEDFHLYGPNEQYLINKMLYSPHNLIYLIGGIGTGKTTFAHYFITAVINKLRHEVSHETSKCPCPIYLDFLDFGAGTFSSREFEKAQVTFSNMLCDRIEHEIAVKEHLKIEEEIGTVWEEIMAEDARTYQRNLAVSFIIAKLREEDAEARNLLNKYEETIAKRKQIRKQVAADTTLRRLYVAALLRYIKAKFYNEHPGCFLIIIDNIDREPTAVQHAIKMVLKPFARISNIKTVVTARQTTFYQALDDGLSEAFDQVAYCGPNPLEIVLGRINRFIENPERYKAFYSPEALPVLANGLKELRDNSLRRDWFSTFFLSFTGRSIRKALILAQHLVDNSVYDLYEAGTGRGSIKQSDVMRALMVGANGTFSWSEGGLIDNIFQVHEHNKESYLIKIRILKILCIRDETGLTLKTLHSVLNGFGYDAELIKDALNELMLKSKRMIWSDEVRRFDSVEDLTQHSNTHLFITNIGKGYAQNLYKMLDYIQEVMLDTIVDSVDFGHDWDYGKMEDRLKLVSLFCAMLLGFDEIEVKKFVSEYGREQYKRFLGSSKLISNEILEAVERRVDSILQFVSGHSRRDPSDLFLDFMKDHSKFYLDRRIRASRFEAEYLGDK